MPAQETNQVPHAVENSPDFESWTITWCQFWLEWLIFFTDPGWRTLMSLQRDKGFKKGDITGKRLCRKHPTSVRTLTLTRTTWLHLSGSPWSRLPSFCQSHPRSTTSAPLPYGSHTFLQAEKHRWAVKHLIWILLVSERRAKHHAASAGIAIFS